MQLQDGWKLEEDGNFIIVTKPSMGYVTIDLKQRGFRLGISYAGRLDSNGVYRGKGWREALIAAAVRRLDDL